MVLSGDDYKLAHLGPGGMDMASMMAGMGGDKPDMDDLDGDSDDEDLPDLEQKKLQNPIASCVCEATVFQLTRQKPSWFYRKPCIQCSSILSFVLLFSTSVSCENIFNGILFFQCIPMNHDFRHFSFLVEIEDGAYVLAMKNKKRHFCS